MNSQLLPVSDLSLVQLRIDERVDAAARARALRGLHPQQTGPFSTARTVVSDLIVGIGQRVRPVVPARDEGDEHVLIPLAR